MERKRVFRVYATIVMMVLLIGLFPQTNAQAATVKLSETKKTVYTGETFELVLKNAKKTVKWKSSNTSVVKVDNNGRVTAIGSGTAKITAKYKSATYTCKITVKAPHISCKSAELYIDGTLQLEIFGAKAVKYVSSDEKVATVSSKGLVTAKDIGTATISILCSSGKTYKCKISVITAEDKSVAVAQLNYLDANNTIYYNDGYWGNDNNVFVDNLGESHEDVFSTGASLIKTTYVIYKVNKEYSSVSGVFYRLFSQRTKSGSETLTIYGDDTKLWEGTVTNGVEPIPFNLDISSYDKITIEIENAYYPYDNIRGVAIGEFRLTP